MIDKSILTDLLPARFWDVDQYPPGGDSDRPWKPFAEWLTRECDLLDFRQSEIEVMMPHIFALYHERSILRWLYERGPEIQRSLQVAGLADAASTIETRRPRRGKPPHYADRAAIAAIWILLTRVCGNGLDFGHYACKRRKVLNRVETSEKYDSPIERVYKQFLSIAEPDRLKPGANPPFPTGSVFESGYADFQRGRLFYQD